MAISRSKKEDLVAQYAELLQASNGFAIVRVSGMSVPQTQALRGKVLEAGGQYVVAKNTLIKLALEKNEWMVPEDLLTGPTAIVFGKDNFPGVTKAVLSFVKDASLAEEKFGIKGGVMGTSLLDASGVEAVSKLPTLDELHAQLAGLVVAPAQGLVSVLHAATGQVVNVLHAYVEDRQKGEGAA
ncbi:50S ribosomal protein L10 [Anaerolineales bacterium]